MNAVELQALINDRLPIVVQTFRGESKQWEQLRSRFVSDYPLRKIPHLTLDEYVIGKGRANRSFCYRIERELQALGLVGASTSYRYGVYFGKTKRVKTAKKQYHFAKCWGATVAEAFHSVKKAIVQLLEAGARNNAAAIRDNPLSPVLKGKLLFLYYPAKFAPIYAKSHLQYFAAELNLPGKFEAEADIQQALMNYRSQWPALQAQTACLFMRFLYDVFPYPPEVAKRNRPRPLPTPSLPLLHQAVSGACFITAVPAPIRAAPPAAAPGPAEHDPARQRRRKRIGNRGELIVLALEKQRLTAAGRADLAGRIVHVADRDDTAGYDVLSFNDDGTPRYIEVKSTTAPDLSPGFYLTANELDKSLKLQNFFVYLVFSAVSTSPRVLPLRQPTFNGLDFSLRPLMYHVIPQRDLCA